MDARVKPGHDVCGVVSVLPYDSALLLSFSFSASRYTALPISLNLALIWAMPSSMVPLMVMPTLPACPVSQSWYPRKAIQSSGEDAVLGGSSSMDNAVDLITKGDISFVVNTPHGRGSREDGEAIRKTANANRIPSVTTVEAALAAVNGLVEQSSSEPTVRSLQEFHGRV